MKPNLRQKPGNVYHTPINTPAETPRRFRNVSMTGFTIQSEVCGQNICSKFM